MNVNSISEKIKKIDRVGFLNIEVDPTLDLFAEIEKLKREKAEISDNNHPQATQSWCKLRMHSRINMRSR